MLLFFDISSAKDSKINSFITTYVLDVPVSFKRFLQKNTFILERR